MASPSGAMIGIQALGNFMQAAETTKAAKMDSDATLANYNLQDAELFRQQTETNTQAGEMKGDRAMQADRDLANLRVVNGERGASAITMARMAGQAGFFEGLDISRIEQNRASKVASLQTSKTSANMDATYQQRKDQLRAQAAITGAVLNTTSSGIQIGALDYRNQRYEWTQSGQKGDFTYKFLGM